MKISRLVSNIPGSETLALTAKVNELRAQGKNVIGFTAGEPDFDTPETIKEAAIDSLRRGNTKYTPVGGTMKLKEAVCEAFERDYGFAVSPENVIVSCGAKHSLFNLFFTLFEEGDEVICPAPYWVSYPPMIEMTGAKPVIVDTREAGMKLEAGMVARAITPRTRGIVINSPSNPTGMVFDRKELEEIAELCLRHDITIISDDIYRKIVFEPNEFFSVASISPEVAKKTFIIDGSSKTYAMTGWRIGFCIGDKDVIKAMERLQSQSTSNPVSFAQEGALASLVSDETAAIVEKRRKIFQQRRDLIVRKIREIPGMGIIEPGGSFYAFPSIDGYLDRFKDANAFTQYLIEHALVAVVPGVAFGAPDHVRFSFATSEENIEKGLDRVKEALASL
ncbi:MAG TPA: pyridoxal phosphate-dependent aminotransferase [Deltaproteobacteria bacterium]|nr:pyridoxal phosphate-dependent aminotransferase [Deltaproteobacteria bacterium]HOM28732.1 pyridoxal phosphate-dependent aminotransferase [Deltaproteobacteria bacterium]HPP79822.1 pyridoxal phosphate-dependent aminotransferase [Deltaproteobacteria bacterium]